jgi:hypothetical protein
LKFQNFTCYFIITWRVFLISGNVLYFLSRTVVKVVKHCVTSKQRQQKEEIDWKLGVRIIFISQRKSQWNTMQYNCVDYKVNVKFS